jgi:hypothetical protein
MKLYAIPFQRWRYVVRSHAFCFALSRQRTYRLFRTLGLRFLCVVNYNNQVVGIITRENLLPESLSNSLLRGRNAHVVEDYHLS